MKVNLSFRDGIPMSACEMRELSIASEEINDWVNALNMPQTGFTSELSEPVVYDRDRHIWHQKRYLHYLFEVPYSGTARQYTLQINGANAKTWNWSAGYGPTTLTEYIDLDPFSLTTNRPYKVTLLNTGSSGEGRPFMRYMYEDESTSGSLGLTLPETPPTFTSGNPAPAVDLNKLVTDFNYLDDQVIGISRLGFRREEEPIVTGAGYNRDFYILHLHDWLFFEADLDLGYNTPQSVTTTLQYNGTTIWTKTETDAGGRYYSYKEWLDLSTLGLTVGNWYKITLSATKTEWDDYTVLYPKLICETPNNTTP